MKRITTLALCIILIFAFSAKAFAIETVKASFLYVATDGSDEGEGTIISPFKTLQKAVEVSKNINGTVVINLRGGVYNVDNTISLTKADNNLVIKSYTGEKATITGGVSIPFSSFFSCHDDGFLDALTDQSARNHILSVNLNSIGIEEYGKIRIQGMFGSATDQGYAATLSHNDKALTIARYPNDSFLNVDDVIRDGKSGATFYNSLSQGEFKINDKRYNNWKFKDVWTLGYYQHDWAESTVPCEYNSESDSIVTYVAKSYGIAKDRRFFFFNVPEELDAPGEWYLDRDTGNLYLYPTGDMKNGDEFLFTATNKTLFSVSGADNITFENLKLQGTCNRGINVKNSSEIVVNYCEFARIGNAAVYFDACKNSGVENSFFHDIDSWGVHITNSGNRKTLEPCNCFVSNCEFKKFSQYKRTYSPAVQVTNTVGALVNHNEIHDAPHFAISFTANDTVFEYNNIYDICQETRDCGAIYTGRRWETWGNEIRYNYLHNFKIDSSTMNFCSVHGVYLDDMSASTRVHGNIFYDMPSASLMGGGRNNQFTSNIMIECEKTLIFDQRGMNWNFPDSEHISDYSNSEYGMFSTILGNLFNSAYLSEAWSKYSGFPKWPTSSLANILNDEPPVPKYNIVKNNLQYHCGPQNLAKNVVTYGDTEGDREIHLNNFFTDFDTEDFSLTEDSILALSYSCPDFEVPDFKEMGRRNYIYVDRYESKNSEFLSTKAFQGGYHTYTHLLPNNISKYAIHTYSQIGGDLSNLKEFGIKLSKGGNELMLPYKGIPKSSIFTMKLVGPAITLGSYELQTYAIEKNGDIHLGEKTSVNLVPNVLLGKYTEGDTEVTVYQIDELK